jgi:hypothetical protein
VTTGDIPTGKADVEKANYFQIIVHLLSSFIIDYHRRFGGFDSRALHQPSPRLRLADHPLKNKNLAYSTSLG